MVEDNSGRKPDQEDGSGREPLMDGSSGEEPDQEGRRQRKHETKTDSGGGPEAGRGAADDKQEIFDHKLLEMLVCPVCCAGLELTPDDPDVRLTCSSCNRWYPIFHGLPFLLPDHEQNQKGGELDHQFRNVPGVAPRKAKWCRWYYDVPRMISEVEEGTEQSFDYRNIEGSVLDIGAGDRQMLDRLGKVTRYTTIDIIPRDRPTVVADAHHLPFRDGTFDSVVAQALIEHVEDEQQVVTEIVRVLKPGGVFIFSAPFIYPIHDAVDYHRFTIYSLRSLARKHDLEVLRITSGGGYFGVLAQHIYQGLKMVRDHINGRFEKKPYARLPLRFLFDLWGMIVYLPFYLMRSLDGPYRKMAQKQQGRIPFVKGYSVVLRKK